MKKYLIFLVALVFIAPMMVFAHQPNYVSQQVKITNAEPDISKAYYGELPGQSAVYTIYATFTLDLYVQILSPQITDSRKDFVVSIMDSQENIIANLSTSTENWHSWYEEFGGDWYWQGPSVNKNVLPGEYKLVVSNSLNQGKYSLAIGRVESFPIKDFPRTIRELYLIKTIFFNEPWWGIFYGLIGKFLLGGLIIFALVVSALIFLIIRFFKKRQIKSD
jgi:hypothetical protein